MKTKFLLDSGDPLEYKQVQALAKEKGSEIWGATTNPTLIARKLAGEKISFHDAFYIKQKEIVDEILKIVPGVVSAEVYSDHNTTADEMIKLGQEIDTWDERIAVKLPTTLEGFKARTALRKMGVLINNTLVFSAEQSFAILLHEKIMLENFGKTKNGFPCFISPFIGRLDERGENGLSMLKNALDIENKYFTPDTCWMLEASIRNVDQLKAGIDYNCELETIRASVMNEWLNMTEKDKNLIDVNSYTSQLSDIPQWKPNDDLLKIKTSEEFLNAIENGSLNISHDLTDKGIDKFVSDWSSIIK